MIQTLEWTESGVRFIDQTKLPTEETYVNCKTYTQVADVIRNMVVRGAPAIGVSAAMGIALGVKNSKAENGGDLKHEFDQICDVIGKTRPTAVNLFWAIKRMQDKFEMLRVRPLAQIKQALVEEAQRMHAEDIAANKAMGRHGATLMPESGGVLTHCNAGALATCGYGTALGVIRAAVEQGKNIHVYADETRPFLQGSRLTAWELMKDGIPTTVISDNMAGAMMKQGKINAIVVGADRIAANGDVANKIGTYSVAVLAKEHGIPFYVAAPLSTVDFETADGSGIPIEQRDGKEVTHIAGRQMVPDGVEVENPAFDVTPAKYVTAIVTERGIARAPYGESLRRLAPETVACGLKALSRSSKLGKSGSKTKPSCQFRVVSSQFLDLTAVELFGYSLRKSSMFAFLLWCILFVVCWPLALLALVLYPFVWVLLLPFRLVGIAVHGALALVWASCHASGAASECALQNLGTRKLRFHSGRSCIPAFTLSSPDCESGAAGNWVHPQRLGGFYVIAVGLLQGLQDQLLFGFLDTAVVFVGRGAVAVEPASRTASGKSSGRMESVEPRTSARSRAFSSSRTLPGQS